MSVSLMCDGSMCAMSGYKLGCLSMCQRCC